MPGFAIHAAVQTPARMTKPRLVEGWPVLGMTSPSVRTRNRGDCFAGIVDLRASFEGLDWSFSGPGQALNV